MRLILKNKSIVCFLCVAENSKVKEESKESLVNEKQGKNGFIKILPSKTLLPSLSSASSSSSSTSSSSGITFVPLSD